LKIDLIDVAGAILKTPEALLELVRRDRSRPRAGREVLLAREEQVAAVRRKARAVVTSRSVDLRSEVAERRPCAVLLLAHVEVVEPERVGPPDRAHDEKALVGRDEAVELPARGVDRVAEVFRLGVLPVHEARAVDVQAALSAGPVGAEVDRAAFRDRR